jgi:triacylglycerol lipase
LSPAPGFGIIGGMTLVQTRGGFDSRAIPRLTLVVALLAQPVVALVGCEEPAMVRLAVPLGADAAIEDAGAEDAAASEDAGITLLGPPYPVVLAHGFFGFESFAGSDYVNYFYGVKDYLAAGGETEVFTPAVDPFNYSEFRGAQLAERVRLIREQTGHAKVILIGHSQGGLDARVVAHDHPDWVAAVVTVATPHLGSAIADIALKYVVDTHFDAVLDFFVQMTGSSLWDGAGEETALAASAHQLATAEAAAFNERYPDAPGIPYWSIGGRSDLHFGGSRCDVDMPPFIAAWTGTIDPIDTSMIVTEEVLDGPGLFPEPNDGLVTVESSTWGTFLGCVPADHFDEMGQLLGDSPGFGNDWDYLQFYADLIAWLRQQGL